MKVTQEKLPASQIGLEIEIPAEMSKNAYEKVVKDLSSTVNIPGFRKGKVPRQILLQRLGTERIKQAALEDLMQDGLNQALKQEAIKAIGNYQMLSPYEEVIGKFKPGEAFTFSVSVDVPPEVTLGEYTGLQVKAEEIPYDPSQVDNFLSERRAEKATLIPVEGRSAQMGDVAVVDYTGRLTAGEQEGDAPTEIQGFRAENFEIELGEGGFPEDIVNGIVGMNVGETQEVPVQFPEDYAQKEFAGKSTVFSISLKDLKEKELPALDDDFAQQVSEFETLSELRETLEARFREKVEQETSANIHQALQSELLNHVEIDLPETMIEQEVEVLIRQTAIQLKEMGIDVNKLLTAENLPQMQERSRPEAIVRLKEHLALQEVAHRESLQVEQETIDAKVKEWLEQLGEKTDTERVRGIVESDLLKEKALKWLEERATVELVPQGSLSATSEETIAESTEDASVTAQPDAEQPAGE